MSKKSNLTMEEKAFGDEPVPVSKRALKTYSHEFLLKLEAEYRAKRDDAETGNMRLSAQKQVDRIEDEYIRRAKLDSKSRKQENGARATNFKSFLTILRGNRAKYALQKSCKGSTLLEYAFLAMFGLGIMLPGIVAAIGSYTEYFKATTAQLEIQILPAARHLDEEEVVEFVEEATEEEEVQVVEVSQPPVQLIDEAGRDLPIEPFVPTENNPVCVEGWANPGNDKCVGRAGENPNGSDDWGSGSKGRSDGKGKNK